jgi:hypothetical protein
MRGGAERFLGLGMGAGGTGSSAMICMAYSDIVWNSSSSLGATEGPSTASVALCFPFNFLGAFEDIFDLSLLLPA